MAAGRAGAAARQKRPLEQLQAAKESLPPPVIAADNDGTSAFPKEAKRTDERPELDPMVHRGLSGGGFTCVRFAGENMCLRASPA